MKYRVSHKTTHKYRSSVPVGDHVACLTPRSLPGAVIHDVSEVVSRAVRMVRESRVRARNGAEIPIQIDTLCVHGDRYNAGELARRLREALQQAGVRVAPTEVR